VEYPLALDPASAAALLQLARSRRRLLHVEHIELLSGVHQALRQSLAAIGTPYQARYVTISPKTPAPRRWSYNHQAFGFPFIGALSRVMRLVDAFGAVEAVTATAQFWGDGENSGDRPYPSTDLPIDLQTELQTNSQANSPTYYQGCWCTGELRFRSGMTAQVTYAKGERLWQAQNQLEVHGAGGSLHLSPTRGQLWTAAGAMELTIGDRRGLFGKDTLMVNDALQTGTPLYVQPEQSLYALRVAAALRQAVQERSLVKLFC
jgi:biliverdin reductase